jgi:hypothetical protein
MAKKKKTMKTPIMVLRTIFGVFSLFFNIQSLVDECEYSLNFRIVKTNPRFSF